MSMDFNDSLAAKQGIGMDLAGLGDLASMLDNPVVESGKPRMFERSQIREDEHNSRQADNPGFSEESIAELAQSMTGGRGIKSPLSLRPDPGAPGYFIINHGHRRFRASAVAGLALVPGFVDENFDKYDQVIENIQRENLSAREIADFIGSELARGKKATDIAQLLGRSKSFLSQHMKLLNLPDPVAEAFYSGQVNDVTLVNELVRAHKENPKAVEKTLAEQEDGSLAAKQLTRATVKALRKPPSKKQEKSPKTTAADSQLRSIEQAVADHLETVVSISQDGKGKQVQLIINAHDVDHLNELLTRLGMGVSIDTCV